MTAVSIDDDTTAPSDTMDAALGLRDRGNLEAKGARERVRGELFGGAPEQIKVGRFSVLEPIGSGGMGVVYAAYDPELDRKVAVKVIGRPLPRAGTTDGLSRQPPSPRLLREAQAMARLSHPNVCTVYEVGTFSPDDQHRQVFIAMEFIRGPTLTKWAEQGGRSWREVVRMYLQAARGLAAAHSAGLVHRDFKPDNVLVGEDGRARVLDFGLARQHEDDLDATDEDTPVLDRGLERRALHLSDEAAIVGTPAFMAPEVYRGHVADYRSDQFSFCVALYEGLYGRRPFEGETALGLAQAVLAGVVPPPPEDSDVPARVWAIVARGLLPDPEQRHPSMAALVAALERSLTAGRRRAAVMLGGGALLVAGAVGYWTAAQRGFVRCDQGADEIAVAWNADRSEAIGIAFEQTPIKHAADTAARVAVALDGYAQSWATQRDDACAATHIKGEQSDALLDLRMQCLEERRAALGSLASAFEEPNEQTVRVAIAAARNLPRLQTCANRELLLGRPDAPDAPELRERVDALNAEITKAGQLYSAGLPAMSDADAALAAARTTGHAPLLARALSLAGSVHGREGNPNHARAFLEEAYWLAIDSGSDLIAHHSAHRLALYVSNALGDPPGGLAWARQAESLVRRFHLDVNAKAETEFALGLVYHAARDLDKAQGHYERAVELGSEALPQSTVPAGATERLAMLALESGRHEEALQYLEEARALFVEHLGPSHPRMATLLYTWGAVHYNRGEYEAALDAARSALDLFADNNLLDHPSRADAYNLMGAVYDDQRRPELAVTAYDEAIRIHSKRYGDDHVMVARVVSNRAISLASMGRHAEALAGHRRALEIFEATSGPETIDVGLTLSGLISAHRRSGDLDAALEALRRAQAMWAKVAPDHPTVSQNSMELGMIRLAQGRKREALAAFEEALGLRVKDEFEPMPIAESRGRVGALLWELGLERERALRLLRQARGAFRELGMEVHRKDLEQFVESQRVPL